jgi:LacI family transcriptional regulator/LacI family repressor for deo operon, udp, cdd, tsx, nupC, and nupG
MKHFAHSGVKIPEQIALTGFDNIILSVMCEPALTTVVIPTKAIAQAVMGLLNERLEHKSPKAQRVELATELIIRGSTDCRATDDMRL